MKQINDPNWLYDTITNYILDIILIVYRNQIVQYATPSIETVLGYGPEEFIGMNAFDPLHPEDKAYLMEAHKQVINTEHPVTNEYRVYHKNGELRYFESRFMPVPDHPDHYGVVTIRDVTERKRIENELQRRKNRYEQLQNSLKLFSQDLSSVMKISELEARLRKEIIDVLSDSETQILIFDRKNQKFESGHFPELRADMPQLTGGKLEYVSDQVLIKIGDRKDRAYILTLNSRSVTESMDSIWLETLVYYAVMVFESLNVIENLLNQLESALQSNETPQWILRLLFNLQEKQRLNLSSDLHDTVLQDQIDLYRRLEALLNHNEIGREMRDQLKAIEQGLLDTIHQIRMTCNELRPPLLREMGLEMALSNLFEYTQLSSTFKISFQSENTAGLSLNEEQTIGTYRIVQELLNNAAKHSKASILHFYLCKQDDTLKLEYSDDGVGFEPEKLSPTFNNMGLSSMRQRAQSLNGSIEFHSQQGSGLRVIMGIPITGMKAEER